MTMLTQAQRDEFRTVLLANDGNLTLEEAAAEFADGLAVADDKIAETAETVADFAARWGREALVSEVVCGKLHAWEGVQVAKGARRGDLFVMNFGAARAVYFTGGMR